MDGLTMGEGIMGRPRFRVGAVTISSEHGRAKELAEFYQQLLGWPIVEEGPRGGWLQLQPPDREPGLTINIEEDREYERPVWPSRQGQQVAMTHLDIGADYLGDAVAWADEAGASLADEQPQVGVRVMLDPHGHPFCLS